MNLATIIDIVAATLGFCAGLFFSLGVLKIKDATLDTIATSMWEKGRAISRELALQKVDFKFGAGFLIFSFLIQVAGKCLPSEVSASVITTSIPNGMLVGLGVPLLFVTLLLIPYFQLRARSTRRLSEKIAKKA